MLDFPKYFLGRALESIRISVGQRTDSKNPFTIQSHFITAKFVFIARIKFITPDKKRLIKIVHFILYFLHKIPFTTCPTPYAKKKNV